MEISRSFKNSSCKIFLLSSLSHFEKKISKMKFKKNAVDAKIYAYTVVRILLRKIHESLGKQLNYRSNRKIIGKGYGIREKEILEKGESKGNRRGDKKISEKEFLHTSPNSFHSH